MAKTAQDKKLAALQKVCSKDETRAHITTPWVYSDDLLLVPGPWAVATDGHRLHACKLDDLPPNALGLTSSDPRPPIAPIVNRIGEHEATLTLSDITKIVTYLKRVKGDLGSKKLCVNLHSWNAVVQGTKWTYTPPEKDKDRPQAITPQPVWVNIHYLLAALDWCARGIVTVISGDDLHQIVMTSTQDLIAVVMPVRV